MSTVQELKIIREWLGVNGQEMSVYCHVHRGTICRWGKDKNEPRDKFAEVLFRLLDELRGLVPGDGRRIQAIMRSKDGPYELLDALFREKYRLLAAMEAA